MSIELGAYMQSCRAISKLLVYVVCSMAATMPASAQQSIFDNVLNELGKKVQEEIKKPRPPKKPTVQGRSDGSQPAPGSKQVSAAGCRTRTEDERKQSQQTIDILENEMNDPNPSVQMTALEQALDSSCATVRNRAIEIALSRQDNAALRNRALGSILESMKRITFEIALTEQEAAAVNSANVYAWPRSSAGGKRNIVFQHGAYLNYAVISPPDPATGEFKWVFENEDYLSNAAEANLLQYATGRIVKGQLQLVRLPISEKSRNYGYRIFAICSGMLNFQSGQFAGRLLCDNGAGGLALTAQVF
jgi:hypothetical protein